MRRRIVHYGANVRQYNADAAVFVTVPHPAAHIGRPWTASLVWQDMAQRSTLQQTPTRRAPPTPVRSRPQTRRPSPLWRLLMTCVLIGLLGVGAWAYLSRAFASGLRSEADTIPGLVHQQVTQNGGTYVALGSISPELQHAIVAIEDRRFYAHFGVDPLAVVRAVWVNLRDQHVDQGGSTLEEQLAKRAIVHNTSSLHDKLRTMFLAWAVDQEFSKAQILEMYLNDAYFGQGAYGAAAAARIYFGTDVAHLTVSQAAFLAAMPQAPSIYGANPRAPAVVDRVRTVVRDMREQGYITPEEEKLADGAPLVLALPNP